VKLTSIAAACAAGSLCLATVAGAQGVTKTQPLPKGQVASSEN